MVSKEINFRYKKRHILHCNEIRGKFGVFCFVYLLFKKLLVCGNSHLVVSIFSSD